jgi:hypothetical protein
LHVYTQQKSRRPQTLPWYWLNNGLWKDFSLYIYGSFPHDCCQLNSFSKSISLFPFPYWIKNKNGMYKPSIYNDDNPVPIRPGSCLSQNKAILLIPAGLLTPGSITWNCIHHFFQSIIWTLTLCISEKRIRWAINNVPSS